jgi:hypothetical protein
MAVLRPLMFSFTEMASPMAKKSKTKAAVRKTATKSRKTKKAIVVKTAPRKRRAAAKKAPRKLARRTSAKAAKKRKAAVKAVKAGKPAGVVAAELQVTKTFVYGVKKSKKA